MVVVVVVCYMVCFIDVRRVLGEVGVIGLLVKFFDVKFNIV